MFVVNSKTVHYLAGWPFNPLNKYFVMLKLYYRGVVWRLRGFMQLNALSWNIVIVPI